MPGAAVFVGLLPICQRLSNLILQRIQPVAGNLPLPIDGFNLLPRVLGQCLPLVVDLRL
jgi:hypothetical protein